MTSNIIIYARTLDKNRYYKLEDKNTTQLNYMEWEGFLVSVTKGSSGDMGKPEIKKQYITTIESHDTTKLIHLFGLDFYTSK